MSLRASTLALATLVLVGVAVWRSGHAPTAPAGRAPAPPAARSLDELMLRLDITPRELRSTIKRVRRDFEGHGLAVVAIDIQEPPGTVAGRDGRLLGKALGTRPWTSDRGRALLQVLLPS